MLHVVILAGKRFVRCITMHVKGSCRCSRSKMLVLLLSTVVIAYYFSGPTVQGKNLDKDEDRVRFDPNIHDDGPQSQYKLNNAASDGAEEMQQQKDVHQTAPKEYTPDWESLDSRPLPQWYDDAKIGIFLHWGVYSVPSFVDVGTRGLSEWFWYYWKMPKEKMVGNHDKAVDSVRTYMAKTYPSAWHYTDFAPAFSAEFFDPTRWAKLFEASGAKYVVLTSKHHDGFTLWGSKHSWNWNAVDNGPHRDIIAELSAAVRQTDVKFGLYHSLYEWFHPKYMEDKENGFTTQNFVKEKMGPELRELIEKYKPEVLWSDGDWEAPDTYWNSTHFLAWLYNHSPVRDTVVTNDRWGKGISCHHGGYLSCQDRYSPDKRQSRKWENCMTIDHESWGFRRNAELSDYYDMHELIELLAKTISNGGNLLMNVGPTADGRILPIFEERLRQLGEWLNVNGEAIYKTQMWSHIKEDHSTTYYTKKGSDVYAIVTQWPDDDQLTLLHPSPGRDLKVSWLGYPDLIEWEKAQVGITLKLPKVSLGRIPCQWAWTFKLHGLDNA